MASNKLLWVVALTGFLVVGTVNAQSPEVLNQPVKTTAKKKNKKAKTSTNARAKFMPGSQETNKERSSRLQRECKGQVNAGACTGYTQ